MRSSSSSSSSAIAIAIVIRCRPAAKYMLVHKLESRDQLLVPRTRRYTCPCWPCSNKREARTNAGTDTFRVDQMNVPRFRLPARRTPSPP
ncbi:hypothetical protein M441DRAFT_275524 [Trichoderma asperellum CBS 433.97]|uniref:Uncharacterized protein n=1 Tax=Trichoderma asperellum (strain ATCC 204424 / CBS 433.97 / NBRC 101777) TaxID=1042311 RepID=A0A2T3YUV1_TRIA4|nr:hypothetical protein M441DRAFT_275524 [Trichoderma asperellum CBS 433.97]PTB36317.1 hypothetical protein M441DRAFT_275524 [Trichoderma asperellum CBS 433.97]